MASQTPREYVHALFEALGDSALSNTQNPPLFSDLTVFIDAGVPGLEDKSGGALVGDPGSVERNRALLVDFLLRPPVSLYSPSDTLDVSRFFTGNHFTGAFQATNKGILDLLFRLQRRLFRNTLTAGIKANESLTYAYDLDFYQWMDGFRDVIDDTDDHLEYSTLVDRWHSGTIQMTQQGTGRNFYANSNIGAGTAAPGGYEELKKRFPNIVFSDTGSRIPIAAITTTAAGQSLITVGDNPVLRLAENFINITDNPGDPLSSADTYIVSSVDYENGKIQLHKPIPSAGVHDWFIPSETDLAYPWYASNRPTAVGAFFTGQQKVPSGSPELASVVFESYKLYFAFLDFVFSAYRPLFLGSTTIKIGPTEIVEILKRAGIKIKSSLGFTINDPEAVIRAIEGHLRDRVINAVDERGELDLEDASLYKPLLLYKILEGGEDKAVDVVPGQIQAGIKSVFMVPAGESEETNE
jgi:hypothetical protein